MTHGKLDGFVKSPFLLIFVIPAKAGIHPAEGGTGFAGVTAFLTFCEFIWRRDETSYRVQGCEMTIFRISWVPSVIGRYCESRKYR